LNNQHLAREMKEAANEIIIEEKLHIIEEEEIIEAEMVPVVEQQVLATATTTAIDGNGNQKLLQVFPSLIPNRIPNPTLSIVQTLSLSLSLSVFEWSFNVHL